MKRIKRIRENSDEIIRKLRTKNDKTDIKLVLSLDSEVRQLKTRSSEYRSQRNLASENIAKIKREGGDFSLAVEETRELSDKLKSLEIELTKIEKELEVILFQIPNIPQNSVHRLENTQNIPLEIIEIQTGSYLGEDDIIRLEDDHKRN